MPFTGKITGRPGRSTRIRAGGQRSSGTGASRWPDGAQGQHINGFHKDLEGWIPSGQRAIIDVGQQSTLTLEQLALPQTGNYLLAKMPINGSTPHFYTVEVRRKVGYDVKLPGQVVILHEVNTTRGVPAFVININGNGNTGNAGAQWLVGETFTDSANQIIISVLSQTATGFVVSLSNQPGSPIDDEISRMSRWQAGGMRLIR